MDNPIYKLEKVVQGHAGETLEDFEGPLDLILFLLSKNKIEIEDLSISLILDQYLEYLEKRKEMDLEIASEFVSMAAHLVYIKTRMLLSLEDQEAKNEMDELIRSLEERKSREVYLRIKDLTILLQPLSEFGRDIILRVPESFEQEKNYEYEHDTSDLILSLQEVFDRNEARIAPVNMNAFEKIVQREPYSVENKAKEILSKLKKIGITSFLQLFKGNKSKSEIVATFMAILELCKNHLIQLTGGISDCTVSFIENAPEDFTLDTEVVNG